MNAEEERYKKNEPKIGKSRDTFEHARAGSDAGNSECSECDRHIR